MLSESDLIDQVNPYINNPPGAWSKPYDFGSFKELPEEPFEEPDFNPVCSLALTAGDKQIDWCKPGIPNCPMKRDLEPTQKVDADISYEDGIFVPFTKVAYSDEHFQILVKILIILLIISLLFILTEKL